MGKILLMIHRMQQGGGTETHVCSLAEQLRSAGHEVGVFTAGGPWLSLLRDKGVRRIHLDNKDRVSRLQALLAVVKREGYQVIHAHDSSSCKLAALLHMPEVRMIITIHGAYMLDEEMGQTMKRADAVIAVSASLLRRSMRLGVRRARLHLIPNGISTWHFHPYSKRTFRKDKNIPQNAFVIGYAGRFTLTKAAVGERVSRIIADYANHDKNVYALVAGRDSKRHVGHLRNKRVRVYGHLDNMPAYYHACDVIVGTGRVILEAAACGVPTVAVGESHFVGHLRADNVERALSSNFGDHGAKVNHWKDESLQKDIQSIHNQIAAARLHAKTLVPIIRSRYTAKQMALRIQTLYGLR